MAIKVHKTYKTEEKYYEKYPLVKLVIDSVEDHITGKNHSCRSVQPRDVPLKRAYLEQLVGFRKGIKIELPYTIEVGYQNGFQCDSDIEWYEAQSVGNTRPPSKVVVVDAEELELSEDE